MFSKNFIATHAPKIVRNSKKEEVSSNLFLLCTGFKSGTRFIGEIILYRFRNKTHQPAEATIEIDGQKYKGELDDLQSGKIEGYRLYKMPGSEDGTVDIDGQKYEMEFADDQTVKSYSYEFREASDSKHGIIDTDGKKYVLELKKRGIPKVSTYRFREATDSEEGAIDINGERLKMELIDVDVPKTYIYTFRRLPSRKPRRSTIHHERVRKVAAKLWEEFPTMTIADMIQRDEITNACDGKIYHENTLRKWIKDLCPNRSPGRRPKK